MSLISSLAHFGPRVRACWISSSVSPSPSIIEDFVTTSGRAWRGFSNPFLFESLQKDISSHLFSFVFLWCLLFFAHCASSMAFTSRVIRSLSISTPAWHDAGHWGIVRSPHDDLWLLTAAFRPRRVDCSHLQPFFSAKTWSHLMHETRTRSTHELWQLASVHSSKQHFQKLMWNSQGQVSSTVRMLKIWLKYS